MSNWQYKTHWERGLEDPYEVHEFANETNSMGPYETEEYLNKLELLLKEAHDILDDDNARVALRAYCRWCNGASYDAKGLIHLDNCILVKIRHVIHT